MLGLTMVCLSAISLALAEIFDTLMVNGDMYKKSSNASWFVSSVFGSVLGISATILAWTLTQNIEQTAQFSLTLANDGLETFIPFLLIIAGISASITLRCYFQCFASETTSTLVGMAIAATPLLVFGGSSIFNREILEVQNYISLIVAVAGLILFEYISNDSREKANRRLALIGVVLFGALYVVILDETIPYIEEEYGIDSVLASMTALPYYWFGFASGFLAILHKEVREFVKNILTKRKYLLTILAIEVVGMSFYFFELIGIGELDVTFLSIVIGSHVIIVWIFDLYMRLKVRRIMKEGLKTFSIKYFTGLQTNDFVHYVTSGKTVLIQFISILLVIIGLVLWPSIH